MWVISQAEFQNITTLAQQFIIKEIAQLPDNTISEICYRLRDEISNYGYTFESMVFREKKYGFAYRDFTQTPSRSLPQVPELDIRRQAEQYESQRQRKGYVTQLELDLADKCIKAGKIEIDSTKPRAYLDALRTIYGLYWMEYERDCDASEWQVFVKAKLRKCRDQQYRLYMLKRYRTGIITAEQVYRLKDAISQKTYELPSFVKDYLRTHVSRESTEVKHEDVFNQSKRVQSTENSSLISKIFRFFKTEPSSQFKQSRPMKDEDEKTALKDISCADSPSICSVRASSEEKKYN